jgi:polyisoprenoid-binding protein YceI
MMTTTTSVSTFIPTGTWSVDPSQSQVGFAVKNMGIATVRGEFKEFEGALEIGDDLSTAEAYGTVKVRSVDTGQPKRDEHLCAADFFDAQHYPELSFESTRIEALDENAFRITGNLTARGVTNEVVLHADVQGTDVDPRGHECVSLEITGEVSRGDYEMQHHQALGNRLIGDKVKLALDVSVVKQPRRR